MNRVQEVRVMLGNNTTTASGLPKRSIGRGHKNSQSRIKRTGNSPTSHYSRLRSRDEEINNAEKELIEPNIVPEYDDGENKHYRDPNGPYTNARHSRILLYFMLLWCVVLTVLCIILFVRISPSAPAPVFAEQKDQSKWHVPFNLVPDEESNGRLMTLRVPHMTFSKLLKYDICCKKGPIYVCRAVSKNVGVEGYFTSDGNAVLHINHPDMVGAQCKLMWIELRN